MNAPRWAAAVRWLLAACLVIAVAWASFARNGWVPFLSGVDLGVHEFGHLVFAWAPFLVVALAGSAVQLLAPAGLAAYFGWRGDRLGLVLMVGWLGMSLHNVSVYVRDATRMALPLFGDDGSGAGHDWRNILGELGWLAHADALADLVRVAAALAFGSALVLVAAFAAADLVPARTAAWRSRLREWAHRADAAGGPVRQLPVRHVAAPDCRSGGTPRASGDARGGSGWPGAGSIG